MDPMDPMYLTDLGKRTVPWNLGGPRNFEDPRNLRNVKKSS